MITPRTRIFGLIAAVLLIAALGGAGAMVYVIREEESALEAQLRTRAERDATEREAAALLTQVADTEDDRAALAQYMLTEDEVVEFLALVETVAAEQGVGIETRALAVAPLEGSETFEYLTLEAQVTGSFDSVTHMLALYESLPYQVVVRKVAIARAEGEGSPDLWTGSYTLYVTKYK